MRRDATTRDYSRAIAAIGLAIIIVLIASLVRIARWVDANALAQEQTVVSNGIAQRFKEIEKIIVPSAVWDEAVKNLDNKFDIDWARKNVGVVLFETNQFAVSAVLDASDEPIYGMLDGSDVAPEQLKGLLAQSRYAITQVRIAEQKRNAVAATESGHNLRFPIQFTVSRIHDGRLLIMTATLVQSDFGAATLRAAHAPIILTGLDINDQFVAEFGKRYLLDEIHVHSGDSRHEAEEAHAGIFDEKGASIATLDWLPERPGSKLIFGIMPWALLLSVFLLAAALLHYRRGYRTNEKLISSEKLAAHISSHDALTGLWNRVAVERRLVAVVESAAERDGGPAVLCIDLDHFTQLNDRLGHDVGDEILRQAAMRLESLCSDGRNNKICARFGGDAFAILKLHGGAKRARELAQAIVATFNAPFLLSSGAQQITCSVGLAIGTKDICDPRELMRRADLALFQAKADGRNCNRVYDENMDANLKLRGQLVEFLRQDLAAGKLTVVYQPQVDLSGTMVGVEALVRWTHAERGPVSPSTFIPLAEQSGLIGELSEFVIRRATEDSKLWPDLKVAINISATHFDNPAFVTRIMELVDINKAVAGKVEFEVTESVLLKDASKAHDILSQLRSAGISIALDDFGTGFSSLSYLRRLPIDKLKIDRSFIADLSGDGKALAMVKAIIDLAHALELDVLAEGVETREQWDALAAAGCSQIQGYFAGPAMPASDIRVLADRGPLVSVRPDEVAA